MKLTPIAIALATLAVSACGGGDSGSSASTSPGTNVPAAQTVSGVAATSATGPATATAAGAGAGAGATVAVETNAMPARQVVALSTATTVAPLPAVVQPSAPVAAELPATLPADHRLCSERQTARHYPALLRDRGVQGLVRLRVKVDPEGRAAEVVIAGGSGWRLLDEAARRVAESCPYTPARRGDQRLASWIEYPVRFALQAAPLQ